MAISHEVRRERKKVVYENIVQHIIQSKKVIKVNELFEEFHGNIFKDVPYFTRSFIILSKDDTRIHTKTAQRMGTLAAAIDIDFPEIKKKTNKTKQDKPLKTDTTHVKKESDIKTVPVVTSTEHEKKVELPTSNELFGDETEDVVDTEDDRFFTDEDGIDFIGQQTDLTPNDNWYSINKRLLTKSGYTDVIKLYKFDADDILEYLAETSEGKMFHFTKDD